MALPSIPLCYKNSHAVWDHTRRRWHSRLYPNQLKLVLNLDTCSLQNVTFA